jgi:predicted lipoprotein with Yx(FWY)xxD motif
MSDRIRAGRIELGPLALVIAVLAACSPGGGSVATSPPAAATAAPATASASPAGATQEITVATDAKVGPYLAGKDGKTLYIFKNDTANVSNCSGDCAVAWPPLVVAQGEQVKGAAGVTGAFSTFARADGSMQVAYNTAPLYYYTPDTAAGDVKGEGVGGVWFVAKP